MMPDIARFLKVTLPAVEKPAQYIGGEINAHPGDPRQARVGMLLCFPDAYTIAMSSLALRVLYHGVNRIEGMFCDLAFLPGEDMDQAMRAAGVPLFGLQSRRPAREFDVLGFTLPSELLATNVLCMLDLAGIPLWAEERAENDPLILGGGAMALHPEPIAPFFDGFLLGDGEDVLEAWLSRLAELKSAALPRSELLRELARAFGSFYAPAGYRARHGRDGRYAGLEPLDDAFPARLRQHVTGDFENAFFPTAPIVPHTEAVHDRITLEVMRGCTWNCRYCQAGMTKRPVRVRSVETLLRQTEESFRNTGYDRVSLSSLSTVDYPDLKPLVEALRARFEGRHLGISLPSLRIEPGLGDIPRLLKGERKSGLTMALEAGSERLRGVISKAISDQDFFGAVDSAYAEGWELVKLYFMIGLPGETPDDLERLVELARESSRRRTRLGKRPGKVNVTISTFVPKPHMPFQWEPMLAYERIIAVQQSLRGRLSQGRIRLKPHAPETSVIECLIARGDRRFAQVIHTAWSLGARNDAWDDPRSAGPLSRSPSSRAIVVDPAKPARRDPKPHEVGRFDLWQQALATHGVDWRAELARRWDQDQPLPWDHIDIGVTKEWLAREARLSLEARVTDNCYLKTCHLCGIDPRTCRALQKPVRQQRRAAKLAPELAEKSG